MEQRKFSSVGFVLMRKNYSEADRFISIYSKDMGRITVLAKGVRKPKSRKRGALEVFNCIRFSGSRGRGIGIIDEVELVDSYNEIRKNIKKIAVSYFFMELVIKLTREGEQNENIFETVKEYLDKLKNETKLKQLRMQFIYDLLVEIGFWPEGKDMYDPDTVVEEIIERKLTTTRVGKRLM